MNTYKSLIILALAGSLLSGCGQLFATPAPTPLPTNTPTLTPTPTTTPTRTPTPTPTFTPTPEGQIVDLLSMRLLAPLDWLVELEKEEQQINANIKEPESGITIQLMSLSLAGFDNPEECSQEYMQPIFQEAFSQMIEDLKAEPLEDLILQDGTTVPRSALVGKFFGQVDFRIELGVVQKNEVCYTLMLNGEKTAMENLKDTITRIYQSIEFSE